MWWVHHFAGSCHPLPPPTFLFIKQIENINKKLERLFSLREEKSVLAHRHVGIVLHGMTRIPLHYLFLWSQLYFFPFSFCFIS